VSSLLSALVVVFVAELGDKTQLVALGLGARHRMAPVLVGIGLAYAATNLLSVAVGGALGAALPTRLIGVAGGLLFLGFAGWTIWTERQLLFDATSPPIGTSAADPHGRFAPGDAAIETGGSADAPQRDVRLVGSVASMMFVAELGDKTMLATATLAATGSPVAVWVGATVGIFLAGAVGVVAGRLLGTRLPERAIVIGSAACFAVFGVLLIVLALA
jgi:putative Ca2+/H+ antiporter (TMEM165/GDT1 family)